MNVCFATEYYPPFAPGGSPWSIRLLAQALAQRGHQVTVVTPNYGAPEREEAGGVAVERFPFWRRLLSGASLLPARDLASPRFHYRLQAAVLEAARLSGAQVIHAQDKHALVGSYCAARRLGRPVFLTLRDTGLICPIATCLLAHDFVPADCSARKLQRQCLPFYLDHYIGRGRWRRARVRLSAALLYADAAVKGRLMARVDGVVAVSRGLLEIYLRAGRGRRERAYVVYTLPPEAPPSDPESARTIRARLGLGDRPVVLYTGKLSLGKGGPVFLRAAELAAAERPDTIFLVAGPDRPPEAGHGTDLRWLGRLPQEDMAALYRAADVVAVPSVGPEAFSRVPLEAAVVGRPAIGARTGGIPEEIVDGETGLLVPRGDADALARAILRLLADPALGRAMGAAAHRFVNQRFGAEGIVGDLVTLYEAALARRSR